VATLHKDVKSAKLRKYFDDEFPKINTNTTIWNAFLKWSGQQEAGKPSADDAKKAALEVLLGGLGLGRVAGSVPSGLTIS